MREDGREKEQKRGKWGEVILLEAQKSHEQSRFYCILVHQVDGRAKKGKKQKKKQKKKRRPPLYINIHCRTIGLFHKKLDARRRNSRVPRGEAEALFDFGYMGLVRICSILLVVEIPMPRCMVSTGIIEEEREK